MREDLIISLFKNKRGDLNVRKLVFLIGIIGIFIVFIYLVSAIEEISTVTLNSTSATNLTTENLTANPTPLNSSQKYIYDWKLGGSSIMALNMPMDGGVLCESNTKVCDYSGNGNNGTVSGATYNSSGGYDNKGAYYFDGSNDIIKVVPMSGSNIPTDDFTYMAWINMESNTDESIFMASNGHASAENELGFYVSSSKLGLNMNDVSDVVTGATTLNTGQWYHVALTRNSGAVKVYVDGVVDGTGTQSSTLNFGTCSLYFGVDIDSGCASSKGNYFKGYIDEVKIYNRSLSTEQISAIYSNNTNLIVSQETMQGDSWQTCATPNNNVEDGTEVCSNTLAVENISVILNSTNIATNYSTDNLTAYPSGLASGDKAIYDWKVDGDSIAVLNMPFDGEDNIDETVNDYSSAGVNVVMGSAGSGDDPTYNATGGYDGKGAFEFTGAKDRLTIMNGQALDNLTNAITVTMWAKLDDYNEDSAFYNNWKNDDERWQVYVDSGTKNITFFSEDGADDDETFTSSYTFPTGQWVHVAIVGNNRNWKIYANGSLIADEDVAEGFMDINHASRHYFGVRRWGTSTTFDKEWDGTLDEIMMFDRALSAEQISAIYNNNIDIIVSQETYTGEVWQTCVTPNNNLRDGVEICSNNISVAGAQIESVVLNSSSGNNYTTDTLTAVPINMLPTEARAIYDWKKNGNSIKKFEMNFDGEKLCNGGTTVCDYIGGYNGTPTSSEGIEYFSTSGYNGTGVYNFNGDDFINVNPDIALTDSFSISAWVRRGSISGTADMIFSTGETNADNRILIVGFNYQNYLYFDFGNNYLMSTTTVVDNDWHYLVFTYNWNTRERNIYLDEINIASDISSADPDLDLPTETRIGNTTYGGDYSYDGKIDEVIVWDMELSPEQVSAMYGGGNYRTDIIAPEETAYGDVWQACATPNNNLMHGEEVCSNNLTIQGIDVSLSSSSGTNYSNENLTASVSGLISGDKAFYDWRLDGSSIMALNMPFDGGTLCGVGNNLTCDYAGGNNGTVTNATYNSTSGYDGKGAYEFDGIDDSIVLSDDDSIDFDATESFTLSVWAKAESTGAYSYILEKWNNGISKGYVLNYDYNRIRFIYGDGSMSMFYSDNLTDVTSWHHVVAVIDRATNYAHIYIDGELNASQDITGLGDLSNAFDLNVGKYTLNTNYFNGTLDELLIFDRALSAEQIVAIYNNNTNLIVSQETIYENNWSVCATPNDNVRNGARVCSNNLIVESIDVTLSSSSATNLTNENLSASVSDLFWDDKAIYNWKLDGSSITALNMPMDGGTLAESNTKVRDYSGNGNNGTVTNATYNSTGGYDGKGAYEFDGVDGKIEVDYSDDFNFSDISGFTVMARVKPNDLVGNDADIVTQYHSPSNNRSWILQIRNGVPRFVGCSNGSDSGSCKYATGTTLANNSGTWYHLAGTWNGSKLQVYLNGVADASTPPTLTSLHSGARSIRLGYAAASGDFNGTMDDVMIFDRALSPEQISAMYNNQTNKIVSQETIYGDVWQACATPNDNVRDDGTVCSNTLTVENVDVALTSTDVSTNFSTENLSASVSGLMNGDRAIYNWKKDGSSITAFNMPMDGGILCSGKVCDYSGNGNNGTVTNATYNSIGGYDGKGVYEFDGVDDYIEATVTQDKSTISFWYKNSTASLWAFVVNSSGTTYVNGTAGAPGQYPIYINGNAVQIGKTGSSSFYNGTIDEVMIFDRTLSPEQISAMYNNGNYRTNIIVSNETLTDQDWKACVTANDGTRNGKEVCSSVLTVMADMTIETSVEPYIVTNGSSVTFDMSVLTNATAIDSTWANITKPDGSSTVVTSFPSVYSTTNATGRYNVTFYANDTAGDRISNDDYFESFVPVTFSFTVIDFATDGVDSSWEFRYRDTVIESNGSSTGNHSTSIPDVLGDLVMRSYTERLQITLEDINATLETGKNFGMDRHTTETGYLVTYGVNNSYAFTNAIVRIYYDDLTGSYSTEGNLKLYKCDNYDFAGRTCSGTWADITSSATQDTGSDYFEYNTTSFSGFSIKEVTPAAPDEDEEEVSRGGGGGGIEEETGIPSQLFDITFNLDDKLIQSVNELSGVVTFESFGLEPTPINLTFIILDESGNEVYREESSITVITEEVLRWKYETLQDLPEGKYTAILNTLYNVDVSDEFRQEFEIGEERGISLWVWIVGGIVVGILIIGLVWWIIKRKKRRAYKYRREESKSFKGNVSEILEEGRIKDEG